MELIEIIVDGPCLLKVSGTLKLVGGKGIGVEGEELGAELQVEVIPVNKEMSADIFQLEFPLVNLVHPLLGAAQGTSLDEGGSRLGMH